MQAASFYARFSQALTASAPRAVPPGLQPQQARRFAVYRNNVHVALIDALGAAYPVVQRLVGEAFFAAMARAFAAGETRRSGSMVLYGSGFAEFIARFPPASTLPYLADVARLERAWLEACHAADADVLGADELAAHGESVASLRLVPHAAARLVTSSFPILDIWQTNRDDVASSTFDMRAQSVLVTRPGMSVRLTALASAVGPFAGAMLSGNSVEQASAATTARLSEEELAQAFSAMLSAGAFSSVDQGV